MALVAVAGWFATRPASSGAALASAASVAPEPTPMRDLITSHPFGGPQRLSLLAGDGHVGWRDGAAAQARFADPYGLALRSDGALYVADAGDNNRIRVIERTGSVTTLAGSSEGFRDGPGSEARFNTPSGLALDATGNLYVADTGNHAIRKVSPQGQVSTLAGNGAPGHRDGPGAQAQFNGPLGVAVDAAGRVFVADTYNDRIRVISVDGQVSTLAGGDLPGDQDGLGSAARFDTPCAVALDAQGRVWVADTRNDALRRIDPDGRVSTFLRTPPHDDEALLRRPLSLAVAPNGVLTVGTLRRGAVLQVSPQGEVHALISDVAGRLARPTAVVLGEGEGQRVLVADASSARIHQLAPRADGGARLQVDSPLGPADDEALPATAGRWPLRPQQGWHEVVGILGEVRGDGAGEMRDHVHDGLDIRGDVGQEVLAIADDKVSSPLGSVGYGKLGEGLLLNRLAYVHMRVGRTARGDIIDASRFTLLRNAQGQPERVRVRRGTRFRAGEVLGSINGMAHVHLSLGASGHELNPLRLGFTGYADHQPPHIAAIEFHDAAGQLLPHRAGERLVLPRADLQLVVDAWDQVDRNLPRRRLGIDSLGYQWLRSDGQPVPGFERPHVPLSFTQMPPDAEAVKRIYADNSGVTVHGSAATHFRYVLSNTGGDDGVPGGLWTSAGLPAGDYLLRIVARDYAGNEAVQGRDLAISLR